MVYLEGTAAGSRTPHGVRGLKLIGVAMATLVELSHPTRGAWIEIKKPWPFGQG